jgi:hypothetical protein
MKTKELTLKQMNSVRCTTCGAATGEPCELHSGALRFEPHRDRKLSAADALVGSKDKQPPPDECSGSTSGQVNNTLFLPLYTVFAGKMPTSL